jgi:hypothetical protein
LDENGVCVGVGFSRDIRRLKPPLGAFGDPS